MVESVTVKIEIPFDLFTEVQDIAEADELCLDECIIRVLKFFVKNHENTGRFLIEDDR
jgi:hypothetical protein